MCGFSFLFDRTGRLGAAAAARMDAAITHRGPEGHGTVQFGDGGPGTVYMSHHRLKIVDLSDAANQPMRSPDGRYALIFNGEIYNWPELRAELEEAGEQFRTHSDTETLLRLLISEGAAALPKLRGMYALVLYDTDNGRVLVARDAAGIKPLFYAESSEGVAFASEVGAVRVSGVVAADSLGPAELEAYLTYRYVRAPRTLVAGVSALRPDTHAQWSSRVTSLWPAFRQSRPALESEDPLPSPAEWRTHLLPLLHQSLTRHQRADVPVGLWLSGGVDSTLLLALACEVGPPPPCVGVSLAPTEGSFGSQDHAYARRAATQFGADFTEIAVDHTLLQHTDEALAALGQPIADSAGLLTWWLAQQTRAAGLKAVMSGAGADEWFGGYNRHRAYEWLRRYQLWLTPVAPVLRLLGRALPTGYNLPGREQLQLARKLLTKLQPKGSGPALARELTALDPALRHLLRTVQRRFPEPWHPADESLLLDHDREYYLPDDVLALTDQMGMRHGLEVRTPYLDQDLTTYVGQLPAHELLRHGPKWMLRALLDDRGGQPFTTRRKEGFGLPLTRWLRLPAYGWLFDPLRRPDHPLFEHLDYGRTQQFLARFQSGRHDLGAEAWGLITLFRWWDVQRFGGPGTPPLPGI